MSDGMFQLTDAQKEHIQRLADESMPPQIKELLKKADAYLQELKKPKIMTGVERIAQERLEQKIKHRHSVKSDYEQYPDFELAGIAEGLLTMNCMCFPSSWTKEDVGKILSKSYEERLVIAGALIAAEIDRLNFKE